MRRPLVSRSPKLTHQVAKQDRASPDPPTDVTRTQQERRSGDLLATSHRPAGRNALVPRRKARLVARTLAQSLRTTVGPSQQNSESQLTRYILSDDDFKTLNSLLNKEVIAYESAHGIRAGAEQLPAWEPAGQANEIDVGRTLGELDLGPRATREVLRFGLEDEAEERRERARRAAERRRDGGTGA